MFVVYTHPPPPPNFTPHRVFWPVVHLRVSGPENAIVDAFLVVGSPRETARTSVRGVLPYMGSRQRKKKGRETTLRFFLSVDRLTALCSP